MGDNYKFFCNNKCEWFPCHNTDGSSGFNCMFCFCPLYQQDNCGGKYTILENGWKDCSSCLIPHNNYDYIIEKLKDNHIKENT